MPRKNRAKQFQPFSPLQGYTEALSQKEKPNAPKIEFSEEYQDELNRKLQQVCKNDTISMEYYDNGEYRTITGMVTDIDSVFRFMIVADTKIFLDDIYDIFFV